MIYEIINIYNKRNTLYYKKQKFNFFLQFFFFPIDICKMKKKTMIDESFTIITNTI